MARVICFRRDMFDAIKERRKGATRRLSGRWMSLRIGETLDARISRGRDEGLRITVTDRRREPLHAMTEEDCVKEGIVAFEDSGKPLVLACPYFGKRLPDNSFVFAFSTLWDDIHRRPGDDWDSNPDVTVIEFDLMSFDPPRAKAT